MSGSRIQRRGAVWLHCIAVGFVCQLFVASGYAGSRITRIQVSPDRIYLFGSNASQQVNVTAIYSDGSEEDVTRTALLSVAAPDHASISRSGLMRANSPGYTFLC